MSDEKNKLVATAMIVPSPHDGTARGIPAKVTERHLDKEDPLDPFPASRLVALGYQVYEVDVDTNTVARLRSPPKS